MPRSQIQPQPHEGEASAESSRINAAAGFFENHWRGHECRRRPSGGRQAAIRRPSGVTKSGGDDTIMKSGEICDKGLRMAGLTRWLRLQC